MCNSDTPTDYKINMNPLLSVKEAALYLNVSESSVYVIAERENFKVVRPTSDIKIPKSELDAYIKRRESTWRWENICSISNLTNMEKSQ